MTVKLTIQSRQARIEGVLSASALMITTLREQPMIKTLREQPRDRKRQNNIKQHSGNIAFVETVNIAWQMQDWSLPRELPGTIEEILGQPSPWAAVLMVALQSCRGVQS